MDAQVVSNDILSRLSILEERLREQTEVIAAIPRQSSEASDSSAMLDVEVHRESSAPEQQLPEYHPPYDVPDPEPEPEPEMVNDHHSIDLGLEQCTSSAYRYTKNISDPPLVIPVGHQTGTGSLFAIEPIRGLIGAYPDTYFYHVETAQPSFSSVNYTHSLLHAHSLNLLRSHTDELVEAFFTDVHPHLPVMERHYFMQLYENLDPQQTNTDVSTALCLVVFALGQLSIKNKPAPDGEDRSEYFPAAYRILTNFWCNYFEIDLDLPIALLYAAQYCYYRVQPLPAWKMVHMASTQVQLIVSAYVNTIVRKKTC